jgi:FkbM family methyltransferase
MPAVLAGATTVTAAGNRRAGFLELLTGAVAAAPPGRDALRLAERFLTPTDSTQRFLLGRNEQAAELLRHARIDGIIDDYAVETSWQGHRIVKSADVPAQAMVVNCALSIRPSSALRRLSHLGLQHCLNYADLLSAYPGLVPEPAFVRQTRMDVREHRVQWLSLFDRLSDACSRRTLHDVLAFRLSADPVSLQKYPVRFSEQYFEDFLRLEREVFVDAGGYDGDTTAEFCRRHPDYERVVLFEPSSRNMLRARHRLAGLRNIEFIEKGLSDGIGTLAFDPDAGSASAVLPDGSCRIPVTTLDAAVRHPVSFIKMDLEGWEMQALLGSAGHIRHEGPKLAISVYHSASDFWRIPELVLGLHEDYELHLRHYTEGWSETVMFFVPTHA